MLYSLRGAEPKPLPNRIRLSDGRTRTDSSSFTPEDIADAGYVLAPEKPAPDPGHQVIWNNREWNQAPLPPDFGEIVGPRGFLSLFTRQQFIAIKRAANQDDIVEHFFALASVPEPIRLKHPLTQQGLGMLVAKGLLTKAEATRISNNIPPTP